MKQDPDMLEIHNEAVCLMHCLCTSSPILMCHLYASLMVSHHPGGPIGWSVPWWGPEGGGGRVYFVKCKCTGNSDWFSLAAIIVGVHSFIFTRIILANLILNKISSAHHLNAQSVIIIIVIVIMIHQFSIICSLHGQSLESIHKSTGCKAGDILYKIPVY